MGAFNQKVTVGKEGEAKAAQVRPPGPSTPLKIILAQSGGGGSAARPPAGPPSGAGSPAQLPAATRPGHVVPCSTLLPASPATLPAPHPN